MSDSDNEVKNLLQLSMRFFPDTMANEAKLKKLHFARKSLLSNLRHAIAAAKALSRVSKPILVVCKDKTLERFWTEFQSNLTEIMPITDHMTDQDAFFIENQSLEDEYHEAKVHLVDIMAETEEQLEVDRTFIGGEGGNNGGGREATEVKHRPSHLPDIKVQPFDGNYDNWHRLVKCSPNWSRRKNWIPLTNCIT